MSCIGIDLGSTHSCVGVFHNGKVNILANNQGFRTTPCYLSIQKDGEQVIGDAAMEKIYANKNNTIYQFHNGSKGEDVSYPVSVVDGTDTVSIVLEDGNTETVTPLRFNTILIENLKSIAQEFTGICPQYVVFSVPEYFTQEERSLMKTAAESVNLTVLQLVNEPTAAAIAYNLDVAEEGSEPELVVVVDVGGNSADVSVLNADQGILEILKTKHNSTIGGEKCTQMLVDLCVEGFKKQHGVDVASNERAICRLKVACEGAKKSLSQQSRVNIEVDSLAEGKDFMLKVSRSRFEDMIFDMVKSIIVDIETLLEDADLDAQDIHKVLMVGGCTRIPLIQARVENFFGKSLEATVIPDEAATVGATVEANTLFETIDAELVELSTVRAAPLSIGLEAGNGSMLHMINREMLLPANYTETLTTSRDDQDSVDIKVFEGERLLAKDNTLLASLTLDGLPKKMAGEVQVKVEFCISTSGKLTVTATEASTGKTGQLEIECDPKRLSRADVEKLIKNAEDALDDDEELINQLESATIEDALAAVESSSVNDSNKEEMD